MSRKLKIAQLIGRFNWGGAARSALNLSVGLEELGHKAICIAIRDDDHFTAAGQFPIELKSLFAEGGALAKVHAMVRLRRLLRNESIDILHVHAHRSLGFAIPALAGLNRRTRTRLCYTWHDPLSVLERGDMADRFLRRALRRCDTVFCCSENIRQRLLQSTGNRLPAEPVRLHNGVPDLVTTQHLDDREPTLLWASRFVPSKDPMTFIEACAELRKRGREFKAIIAGDAHPHAQWYTNKLKHTAREAGLDQTVTFTGWMNDLTSLYQSAAIGVQTSHAEGLSMTLLEEMMAGMAVVATDVGGTAEAVDHERSGLIIQPEDRAGLVDALDRVITDADFRARLGHAARQEALTRFTCKAMAQVADAEYQAIAQPVIRQ